MFEAAIKDRDAEAALTSARQMRSSLDLAGALQLTAVMGFRDHPRYRAAAEKIWPRYVAEVRPGLEDCRAVLEALLCFTEDWATQPRREGATRQLLDLADELRSGG